MLTAEQTESVAFGAGPSARTQPTVPTGSADRSSCGKGRGVLVRGGIGPLAAWCGLRQEKFMHVLAGRADTGRGGRRVPDPKAD